MSDRLQVQSKEVEGVVFYGSNDGKVSGISQSGLAKVCGVTEGAVRSNPLFKTLKTVPALDSSVVGGQLHGTVNIVEARDAMKMLRYFAYESKAANETAKFFYHKFAEEGAHTFCLNQSGVEVVTVESKPALSGIIQLAEDYIKLYRETERNQQGLHQINQGIINSNQALSSGLKTLTEYLLDYGIVLDKGQMVQVSRKIAEVYATHRNGDKPPVIITRYITSTGRRATNHVFGYTVQDHILIKIALSSVGLSI